MRIKNFVSGIIWLVLSAVMSFICYNLTSSIELSSNGLESFALIVTVPLLLLFYLMLVAFLLGAVINTILAVYSDSKAIKIISIILILIEIGLILFDFFTIYTLLVK